jgi:hypothetical protein
MIETATDLLDTQNILTGMEPRECVQICDSSQPTELNAKLVAQIKDSFVFLEDLNAATNVSNNENYTYIHLLCLRVLNECLYLLNEVGVWCLAKSFLPFICQLDKLSLYLFNANKKSQTTNNEQVFYFKSIQDNSLIDSIKSDDPQKI